MARFVKNSVDGKAVEGRSGWAARREKARQKRGHAKADRQAIAAQRAGLYASMQQETEFNPQVGGGAPEADDYISNLSDADLAAYYAQLTGKPPHHKAKRPAIERTVRKAEADRAAAKASADETLDLTEEADDGEEGDDR